MCRTVMSAQQFQILYITCCFINFNLAYNYKNNTINRKIIFPSIPKHPEFGLTVPQLIKRYGYPIESHKISTADKYILTMHRIPHGKLNGHVKNKRVVLLMHGLLTSSADWVLMGPQQGLAYLLADLGYDVWMGNARGNVYSRQHSILNPDKDPEYWDYSWHEIGIYDLPKMIDSALKMTGNKKLYYIGHSQGSTAFFVMTSMLPKYNKKVRLMFALAPAVFMKHVKSSVIKTAVSMHGTAELILKFLGKNEFMPSTEFKKAMSSFMCHQVAITHEICSDLLFSLSGSDEEQLNKTMLPIMLSHIPAGSSTKQFIHFAQEVKSGKFRQYDYGPILNLVKYNSSTPPNYNLRKVTVPIVIIYGKNDLLVAMEDVKRLAKVLPNLVKSYLIPYKKFSHLDFLWANDVVSMLYSVIFELLAKY